MELFKVGSTGKPDPNSTDRPEKERKRGRDSKRRGEVKGGRGGGCLSEHETLLKHTVCTSITQ